jgi:hypothetical protein
MKLCSYVIKTDAGLAPNPFHGFCTNALCTPSHMNARLERGDWLIGNSPKADGNRLVYAMRISEVLDMDQYFHDRRFQAKKPKVDGKPEEQCGDNFYYRENGMWKRLPSRFHNNHNAFVKDVGKNRAGRPVFAASHFYYFGDERVAIPDRLKRVIRGVQGIQYTKGHLAEDFVLWLEANYRPGIIGHPTDIADKSGERGMMITDYSEAASGTAIKATQAHHKPAARPRHYGGCR